MGAAVLGDRNLIAAVEIDFGLGGLACVGVRLLGGLCHLWLVLVDSGSGLWLYGDRVWV
jgi:hypothetical protein